MSLVRKINSIFCLFLLVSQPAMAKMKWLVVEPSPGQFEIIGAEGFRPKFKIIQDAPLDDNGKPVEQILKQSQKSKTAPVKQNAMDSSSPFVIKRTRPIVQATVLTFQLIISPLWRRT